MPAYKSSPQAYLKAAPAKRIILLRWWFLLILILGLIALGFVLLKQSSTLVTLLTEVTTSAASPISSAYADEAIDPVKQLPLKAILMCGVFVILGIVYLASIFKVFFSKRIENVNAALDLVKTLTGFFVGVGTSIIQ